MCGWLEAGGTLVNHPAQNRVRIAIIRDPQNEGSPVIEIHVVLANLETIEITVGLVEYGIALDPAACRSQTPILISTIR